MGEKDQRTNNTPVQRTEDSQSQVSNWSFFFPLGPATTFKITTMKLNTNYKLFGVLAQDYYYLALTT